MLENDNSHNLAADFLTNFPYGLEGLDDAMLHADDVVLYERPQTALEGFIGAPLTQKAVGDARRVVAAATTPGTATTQVVADRLLHRSLELGKLAHERGQVAFRARKKRDELARKVDRMQKQVDRNPQALKLKQDQLALARAAVRLEKVNAVATGMAQNAAAQAVLAQQIAGTVIAGKPALTATLTDMYNKLGQSSARMRQVREKQIVNSANVLDQDKVRALLEQKRGLLQKKLEIDVLLTCAPRNSESHNLRKLRQTLTTQVRVIDAEVKKLCSNPRPTELDGLEWPGFLDKAVKKIGRAAKSVVKTVSKPVASVVKAVAKPVVSAAGAAAKVALLPTTATVNLVTKGPAGAVKHVSRTMKRSFNTVRKAAGQVFIGLPCKFATSTVGKAAMQVGAAAVGTAVGGPAGTVAGAVAANRAADLSKSVCGGLDRIGLTSGDFRTSKLGSALKYTALSIGKNLTDPKKLMRDATSAATAYAGGSLIPSGSFDILNKVGGAQLQKLGLPAISKNIGLPGGASKLLNAVGVPTDVVGVLKAAGVPTDAKSVLRAVGVPTNAKDVLKKAGVPTDLPSMLKATKVLQAKGLKPTPENLAKAMGIKVVRVPGSAGKIVKALSKTDVLKARKLAAKRLNLIRKRAKKKRASQLVLAQKQAQKLVSSAAPAQNQLLQLLYAARPMTFPSGSGPALLTPYV